MEFKGLLFDDVAERFDNMIDSLVQTNNHVQDYQKKLLEKYDTIINEYEEHTIEGFLNLLTPEQYGLFFQKHIKNERIISDLNEDCFRYFFAYILSAGSIFHKIIEGIPQNGVSLSKMDGVTIALYGYLVRLADQIGVLLLNGYPDGAFRIWRSFYEASINLLLLLKENNEDLAVKFIDYTQRSRKRKVDSYEHLSNGSKFPPLDKEFLEAVNSAHLEYAKKYGKDFLNKEFGWAIDVFPNVKPSLREAEKYVGMQRYRAIYVNASSYSHVGFESMIDFFNDEKLIMLNRITQQREERKGLIDPMQFTLSVFHDVHIEFLYRYSVKHEYEINLAFLKRLYEKTGGTFDEVS